MNLIKDLTVFWKLMLCNFCIAVLVIVIYPFVVNSGTPGDCNSSNTHPVEVQFFGYMAMNTGSGPSFPLSRGNAICDFATTDISTNQSNQGWTVLFVVLTLRTKAS